MLLTDNGSAFSLSPRVGTSQIETYMQHQKVTTINNHPNKPTTQNKNKQLHQTIQQFLNIQHPIHNEKQLIKLLNQFDK